MNYPSEFSDNGRAAVEAALILERREHLRREREWKSDWPFNDERSLETFVLKVFSAYAREVIKVGQNELWTLDQMRKQGEEGLRLIVIEINHQTGHHGRFMDGPYLSSKAKSKFRETVEWLDFEDRLLEIAGKHTPNEEATREETPERPRAQPGPKPDYETAARVAEIVGEIAGSEPWTSKLDDICDALVDEKIPPPKTWAKKDPPIRSWTDAAVTDRDLARKAIDHHLKNARS